jgi:hypothetical protein
MLGPFGMMILEVIERLFHHWAYYAFGSQL